MLIISNDILHSLLKVDKQNRDFYLQNYKKLVANIQNLDKEIKKILSPLPKSSKFMVFHPSWGYFARDYNLLQLPIEIEGKSPKPSQLIKLIKIAKKDGIKVIIAEPEFSTKSADILAKEIGAKVIKLSPLSANWQESLLTLAKSISKGYSK
jgi:zinc transport system substrate-binding protein